MLVNRDPCEREELHKQSAGQGECDWCGTRKRVWKYRVETDGGSKFEIKGLFCCKGCMESYHGRLT